MRTYKDKEELKNEINKSFEKYISEFDNIPESLKDKRIIEVDRTPAENLAYQVGWTTLVLKWEDDEKQGIEVKTPSDMFKWNQLGELYQWFTDTYSYLSLAELKDRLKENITSIHTMIDSMSDGTIRDLRISPVKSATLSLSYYTATLFSTLIICFAATGICLTYVAIVGWNMLLADIFFLFLDILLLVLFGTALSSIINFFLSTQGQISAVGTIISAGYGFICGAYMPISSFGKGLQKIISFLPGTYGTSLIRNHTMQGALAEIQNQGIPIVIIEKLKDSLDCNLYFFGSQVNIGTMYMILGITILVLIGIYILLNKSKKYNR